MKTLNTFKPVFFVMMALLTGTAARADINYAFVDGDEFDNKGIGATMTRADSANPTDSATLTSWDILASVVDADLTTMTSARDTGDGHLTNVGTSGLGINNIHIGGGESANFKQAETWVVTFDKDVYLTSIDLDGMSSSDTMELRVDGVTLFTFDDQDPAPNDPYDLAETFVAAGTEVAFADISGGSIRIESLSVSAATIYGAAYSIALEAPNGWRIPKVLGGTGTPAYLTGFDYFDWYGITEHRSWFKPSFSTLTDDSNITSASAFAAASEAIRQDPMRQATASDTFIDWDHFFDQYNKNDMTEHMRYLADRDIEPMIANTTAISDTSIEGDWVTVFQYWKYWYSFVYYFASQHDITMYEYRNEPHAREDYNSWESQWLVCADAMRKAMDDVNADFGKSLKLNICGPTCAGAYFNYEHPDPYDDAHGWGSVSWEKVKYDIYGNYDENNPWNYGSYDYHRYGQNAADTESILKNLRSGIANAQNDPNADIPLLITEYNTSTGGNFDKRELDTEDLYYGVSMAQIMEASAVYGPDGLGDDGGFFIFKLGATADNTIGIGNKLSYVSRNEPGNYGGISRGGATFQMYARHFRGGKPLIPVSVVSGGNAERRTVAAVDAEKEMVYIYGSNVDGTTAPVSIDLSALDVDADTVVTLQRVDEKNTGQITEFLTVDSSKSLSFSCPNYTAFLIKVPMAGSVVNEWTVSAKEDTTQAVIDSGDQGSSGTMKVSMHHSDAAQRNVGLLRFRVNDVDTMGQTLLMLSGKNTGTDQTEREIVHVYAVKDADWDENSTMDWSHAPGLGQYHIDENTMGTTDGTGDMVDIEDNYAGLTSGAGTGLGLTGEFVGAVSFHSSEFVDNYLDVTDTLKSMADGSDSVDVTFVVARIVRYNVNDYDNGTYYNLGDYHYDGRVVEIATKEQAESERRPKLVCSGRDTLGLVANWTLDDGSGTTASDESGNGLDGTISGATWVAGANGSALDFNGSSSLVTLPSSAFASVDNQITISMWVYGDTTQPRNDSLFYATDSSGKRMLNIHLPFGNKNVYWDAGNGSAYDRIYKAASPADYMGKWNHWAFTKNAVSGEMNIYLNGTVWHTGTGNTETMSGIASAMLGGGASYRYDGMIDEVRLYDVALSESDVENLYNEGVANSSVLGLAADWTLDDGSGTTVSDHSGNGFDGTVADATWVAGVEGSALEFDGYTSLVTLPGAAFKAVNDQISIAMWIYGSTDQPRNDAVFYATDEWGNRMLNIHLPWGSKTVYWDAGNLAAVDRINKVAASSEFMGAWNHWAFTKNATTGEMSIYLNGSLWHTGSENTAAMSGIAEATLGGGATYRYAGMIDDVQLYNVALSASDVADLYGAGVPQNTAPIANNKSISVDENSSTSLTLTGSDADGDSLTYSVVSQPDDGSLSGTAPNLTYTPDADYNGSDSFDFRVNDGTENSANATVSITVNNVNVAPVASAQSVSVDENSSVSITLSGSDADGDSLTYEVVNQPGNGALSGTAPYLTYTPDANYSGSDSFIFRVNDGTVNSATATVSITVNKVNVAPVASPQSVIVDEDSSVSMILSGSDADGDNLTYSVVSQPSDGNLSGTAPNLTYTPNANYSGSDSFTFGVNDGTENSAVATVSITVNASSGGVGYLFIQAEDYTDMNGIQTETTSDTDGGENVGWTDAGDWMDYEVYVPSAGTYAVNYRVASRDGGGSVQVQVDGTAQTTIDIDSTGGWQEWTTLSTSMSLSAGTQTIRIYALAGGWNINWFELVQMAGETYLVGHWPLDDGSGTTATDHSGNGFDGTITDGTWTTGIDGGALDFDGNSSLVTLPASAFADISDQITIAMWVYGDTTQPRNDSVFYATDASGNRLLNIHLPWSNSNVYWDAGDSGYDRISKAASTSEFMGDWNHWVFTKNATTGEMNIYLNGALWHTGTGNVKTMSGITMATLGGSASYSYDGMIDDVRLYNVALDEQDVADLYFNGGGLLFANRGVNQSTLACLLIE